MLNCEMFFNEFLCFIIFMQVNVFYNIFAYFILLFFIFFYFASQLNSDLLSSDPDLSNDFWAFSTSKFEI